MHVHACASLFIAYTCTCTCTCTCKRNRLEELHIDIMTMSYTFYTLQGYENW